MKLELNVVRMANEDVIATSGICKNITKYHIKVTQYIQGDGIEHYTLYPTYNEAESKLNYGNSYTENLDNKGVDESGWYYSTDGGISYIKCDENCEHPHGH